jgi:hypothetical protein
MKKKKKKISLRVTTAEEWSRVDRHTCKGSISMKEIGVGPKPKT